MKRVENNELLAVNITLVRLKPQIKTKGSKNFLPFRRSKLTKG